MVTITPNPLIPAGAVATIDRLKSRLRDDTCVIQRPAGGVDYTGAPSSGVSTVATVPCRVTAPARQPIERAGGAGFGAVVDYEVHLARGVDVRSEDRIVVNGRTLLAIADQDAKSHGFEVVVAVRSVEA